MKHFTAQTLEMELFVFFLCVKWHVIQKGLIWRVQLRKDRNLLKIKQKTVLPTEPVGFSKTEDCNSSKEPLQCQWFKASC